MRSYEDRMANPTVTLREERNWGWGDIPGAHFSAHRLGFLLYLLSPYPLLPEASWASVDRKLKQTND